MKWLVASILVLSGAAFCWKMLVVSWKILPLTSKNQVTIEVDGKRVNGDMLAGLTAILTTRDGDKSHSYQLFYAGDVDPIGDIGSVVDCGSWVAPRLPFLIATYKYPPCRRHDPQPRKRRSLLLRHGDVQFVTDTGSIVKMTFP